MADAHAEQGGVMELRRLLVVKTELLLLVVQLMLLLLLQLVLVAQKLPACRMVLELE